MELFIAYDDYMQAHRTKQAALFHAMRDAVLNGSLEPHTKLPSTRQLAHQFELSRGTVNAVYDMLLSQGYIYAIAGSGTFVGDTQQLSLKASAEHRTEARLSDWGRRIQGLALQGSASVRTIPDADKAKAGSYNVSGKRHTIEFSLGKVELAHFPMKEWNRHLYEQAREQYQHELRDAYSSDGHDELKQAIARQVRKERGIVADADDIMIVNGSQQAIALLAQLLLNQGDYAAIEDPHYVGARNALLSVGARLDAFPVDEQGICFRPQHEGYKLLLLTPSRQFPTGVVLSMERRLQLLQWAQQHNSYIIEDDYDSEFRHVGRAIEPMKSLDQAGRVIYVGTFSRTMLQDLRIGYAILPQELKEPFRYAKMVYERHPSSIIQQRALAAFMNTGQYDRHLRRLKRLYRRRAELMQQLLAQRLQGVLAPYPSQAGLHIYAVWQGDEQQFVRFLQACADQAVYVVDARKYQLMHKEPALCLGYAHLNEQDIEEGIVRLQRAWEAVQADAAQNRRI